MREDRATGGCAMFGCSAYIEGKCYSELDYVDKDTGEDMCYRNPDAVPRIQYEGVRKINQLCAEVDRLRVELAQSREREAAYRKALEELQWLDVRESDGFIYCIDCGNTPVQGHDPNCVFTVLSNDTAPDGEWAKMQRVVEAARNAWNGWYEGVDIVGPMHRLRAALEGGPGDE